LGRTKARLAEEGDAYSSSAMLSPKLVPNMLRPFRANVLAGRSGRVDTRGMRAEEAPTGKSKLLVSFSPSDGGSQVLPSKPTDMWRSFGRSNNEVVVVARETCAETNGLLPGSDGG
jgi:hypothetical protein